MVERLVYTEDVGSSSLSSPTIFSKSYLNFLRDTVCVASSRSAILLDRNVFEPVNHFAVERFLDRDMGHRRVRRGTVPVFFARRKPDDVARANLA